jgi:hypothetical protein
MNETQKIRTKKGLILLFFFSTLSLAASAASLASFSASLAFFLDNLAAYVGLNLSPRQTRMLAFINYRSVIYSERVDCNVENGKR